MTDTEALERLIDASGLKKARIAEAAGFKSVTTLYNKIKNRSEFTAPEISALCDILHITKLKDRQAIFFANEVQKN